MNLSEVDQLSTIEMRAVLYQLASSQPEATRQAVDDVLAITRKEA